MLQVSCLSGCCYSWLKVNMKFFITSFFGIFLVLLFFFLVPNWIIFGNSKGNGHKAWHHSMVASLWPCWLGFKSHKNGLFACKHKVVYMELTMARIWCARSLFSIFWKCSCSCSAKIYLFCIIVSDLCFSLEKFFKNMCTPSLGAINYVQTCRNQQTISYCERQQSKSKCKRGCQARNTSSNFFIHSWEEVWLSYFLLLFRIDYLYFIIWEYCYHQWHGHLSYYFIGLVERSPEMQ